MTAKRVDAMMKTHDLTPEEQYLLRYYIIRIATKRLMTGEKSDFIDTTVTIRTAIERERKWQHDDSVLKEHLPPFSR